MTKGRRILVVEDERVLAAATSEYLSLMGYDVIGVCPDGECAVESALSIRPDLILMDIKLKGKMDGIQAVERIHREAYIPVLYLTAYSEPATIERANMTQHSGFVKKPVMEEDLEITVAAVLRKERA